MFEVGRSYKVTTREGDETGYITRTVLEVDMPLVKFSSPGNYIIINTASASFVSAIPNDAKAQADEAADMARFQNEMNAIFDAPEDEDQDTRRYDEIDGRKPSSGY